MRLFWKIISSYHQIVDDKIINNIRMNCKYLEFIQELKTGCMSKLWQIYFRKTDITFRMQ